MAHAPPSDDSSSLDPISQFRSLTKTYWIANLMEMFERLAYYGLRTVVPVYMLLALEDGGPQFDNIQKGQIFAAWAAVQSFIPVFSGGLADRFGYKITVGISVAIKVLGYLMMAFAMEAALMTSGGLAGTVPGHAHTYWWFMLGALLLALGTAVFKPGLQGIIATQIKDSNASLAWALFYQLVNLGGFFGPYLASYLRLLAWRWVFVACAVIVCVNYLLLLTFPEPDKPAQEPLAPGTGMLTEVWRVVVRSVGGLFEPRLLAFLAVFSGFWAMFNQLFDLLPNFIDDWVDSRDVVNTIAAPVLAMFGASVPAEWGGNLPQEQMINLNAGLIMFFAFIVGYLTGLVRSMTAMIAGILVSTIGIYSLGLSMSGWTILGAIAIFSLGEMMASPTKMRYFASIAPPGKKALYLGYINATNGIGWTLGSLIAGELYETRGDKVVLARRYLIEEQGMDAAAVDGLAKTEVLPTLAERVAMDGDAVRILLWDTYAPYEVWSYFSIIGIVSMVGLVGFDLITRYAGDVEEMALILLTALVTGASYGWQIGLGFGLAMAARMVLHKQLAAGDTAEEDLVWRSGAVVAGVGMALWLLYVLVF